MMSGPGQWLVYIIEASDGRLYTGITNDLEKRWRTHTRGKGAKFFRGRIPVRICYTEICRNRSEASKREAEIKKMERNNKKCLISQSAIHSGSGYPYPSSDNPPTLPQQAEKNISRNRS